MSAETNTSSEWVKSMAASLEDEDCGPAARLLLALAAERDALTDERNTLRINLDGCVIELQQAQADRDRLAAERDALQEIVDVRTMIGTARLEEECDRLAADVARLRAFVENVATPRSEPLNSAVLYRAVPDRTHFMSELRQAARAALGDTPLPVVRDATVPAGEARFVDPVTGKTLGVIVNIKEAEHD